MTAQRFIDYDGQWFLKVTDRSAVRHAEPYRLAVLSWEYPGGEVQCKVGPAIKKLYNSVKSRVEGIV